MLDYRLLTFMNLHQTMNYTRTAKNLNITQPAVTQHIKYLEAAYKVKLFHYAKKKLTITKEGEYLYRSATALHANSLKVFSDIQCLSEDKISLKLGASPTIAQSWMPFILKQLDDQIMGYDLELSVDMSETLIQQLRSGKIDMAFVDGNFDRSIYHSYLLRKEEVVLAVPHDHPLASKGSVNFTDLFEYRVLHGDDFDSCGASLYQALQSANLDVQSFPKHMVIHDVEVIKEMVKKGAGVGFVYQSVIAKEVHDGELAMVKIKNAKMTKEFFMVYLQGTIFKEQFQNFYQCCTTALKAIDTKD